MFYVVNKYLNDLYVLSNKAVGPEKKNVNVRPTSIPEARVFCRIFLLLLYRSRKVENPVNHFVRTS